MEQVNAVRFDLRTWPVERIPIAKLCPSAYNPRKITRQAQAALRDSLRKFGLVEPIVWNRRSGNVVGGHQRLTLLTQAGAKDSDCVVVDLSEADEKALNLTLNNPHAQGSFDGAKLDELLSSLRKDLKSFEDLRLDKLLRVQASEPDEDAEIPRAVQLEPSREYVVVMCSDASEWEALKLALDLKPVRRGGYKKGSAFDDVGTQRVVQASELIGRLSNAGGHTKQGTRGRRQIAKADHKRARVRAKA